MSDAIDRAAPDRTPSQAALTLIDAGRADDAVVLLHRFLADEPTDVTALALLSLAHLRAHRWTDALTAADLAIGLQPDYPQAWQRRAIALIELDRTADAEAAAGEYLRLAADDWHAHYTLARVLRVQRGKRHAALRHAQRAVELAPGDADAHNLLGVVHRTLEDKVSAGHAYRAALAIDPTHALARSNLALLSLGQADHEHVMAGLREAASIDPQQAVIHRNMALVAVLTLVRWGTFLALGDLLVAAALLTDVDRPSVVARLVVAGLIVLAWVVAVGWWLRRLRPYLRSLVPVALSRLLRTSDARWGMAGLVLAVLSALVAALVPVVGLAFVGFGYVVQLAGSATSRVLAARHRKAAASDRA
jgi:Flp pilus assembly protein TadD